MPRVLRVASLALLVAGCSQNSGSTPPVSPTNHKWFPISEGSGHAYGKVVAVDGQITCDSCHRPTAPSFSDVRCDTCHKHSADITPRLHLGVPDAGVDLTGITDPDAQAEARGATCYACHPTGEKRAFSHADITNDCAPCHAPDTAFAALPKPGFTHMEIGTSDCGACHKDVADWKNVSGARDAFDPLRDVVVNALAPAWSGPVISRVTPDQQTLHMTMNHSAAAIPATAKAVCSNCHGQADQGQYYPGVFHWSLIALELTQPTTCRECHDTASLPRHYVGRVDTGRTPSTGPMRHDAVVWANGAPTTTKIVTQECVVCHLPPSDPADPTWYFDSVQADGGLPVFHASLTAAGQAQPTSCIDCHANSRPTGNVTSASITFDHSAELGDCAACHASFTSWTGGVYHRAGSTTPTTCLPCHAAERPTSTTGWMGNYMTSPFDYVTNENGVKHVGDLDCAGCHNGPGTGQWGSNQNWRNGRFGHPAPALGTTSCIDCHTTQRPDRLTPAVDAGFDHASNGTGDCRGCHEATVMRGSYVNLYPIPGGDWRGGQSYPGASLISVPNQSVRVLSTVLTRDAGVVVGMVSNGVNLPNAFRHTSTAIPTEVFPGPETAPDQNSCWHCHTATGTTVTAYSGGVFHSALDNYKATPAAAVTPLAQPTVCLDCHDGMRPPNIVSKTDAGTWLLPMDHASTFTGGAVPGVAAMDCGKCHRTPGLGPTKWSDGKYHSNLPTGASPSECVSCHWPLSTTAQADVTVTNGSIKHRSARVTSQACATCHAMALGKATQTPTTTTLWRTGLYHANTTPQPTGCTECHAGNVPAQATQSTVTYTLAQGGTASNGAQWMNHADTSVTTLDCARCHQADAKASGAAWSRSTAFHQFVSAPARCNTCHGTSNGRGTTVGTNNNMPVGLNDTSTTTTSSAAAPGTKDQIAHTDSNVTRNDCKFCHRQAGPSTTPGIQGKEWAQASFHKNFTTANPAIYDGTTGRCSNCHMNVKPGASFTAFDHAQFSATAGTQDCGACHSWPGTDPLNPNWLGAEGKPHPDTGTTVASTLDCNSCHGQAGNATHKLTVAAASHFGGITNGNTCTSCHINFAGFKGTVTNLKYAHTNATANGGNGCSNCHLFSNQLYTTLTTTPPLTFPVSPGGHQFSETRSVSATWNGTSFTAPHTDPNLARCGSCHVYAATTATTNVWVWKHWPSSPGISRVTTKSAARNVIGCNKCH